MSAAQSALESAPHARSIGFCNCCRDCTKGGSSMVGKRDDDGEFRKMSSSSSELMGRRSSWHLASVAGLILVLGTGCKDDSGGRGPIDDDSGTEEDGDSDGGLVGDGGDP